MGYMRARELAFEFCLAMKFELGWNTDSEAGPRPLGLRQEGFNILTVGDFVHIKQRLLVQLSWIDQWRQQYPAHWQTYDIKMHHKHQL